MKRYQLFYSVCYEPATFKEMYKGAFHTIEKAKEFADLYPFDVEDESYPYLILEISEDGTLIPILQYFCYQFKKGWFAYNSSED